MPGLESLGIKRVEAIHYYVRDLERSRRFYAERMDFALTGESDDGLTQEGQQKSLVFEAGGCRVVCSSPVGPVAGGKGAPAGKGGRAARYLEKHPDGIGSVVLEVENAERCFALLEARGGTPISGIESFNSEDGKLETFSITTPFGGTTFRFVERQGDFPLYPGMRALAAPASSNRYGFLDFDHITSNFETMTPTLLWLEHVLGFERFWQVEFHTDDVKRVDEGGSGLRSVVMRDAHSGVKFANNEPYRPNFKQSQINLFHEQNRGDGIQHIAFGVRDILGAVRGLRAAGVEFMPTPQSYYDMLPARLARLGIEHIDEDIDDLAELGVLVDGAHEGEYMLQIFLKDSASLYGSSDAGPFFYEVIQRKGDQGFGAGNFRALFESIEREQTKGDHG
jgi:4-hydroxyphenylpyruvate dioxygenase